LHWDTAIGEKATELARFLIGRSKELDFTNPVPILEKSDDLAIRRRILSLTQKDAIRLGLGKSTLHNLRRHAQDERSFRVSRKIRQKIAMN